MERPASHLVDNIIDLIGISAPTKSHRKIVNSMIRLLYYSGSIRELREECPLNALELKILYIYYEQPRRVSEILSVSDRALRNRMLKIRNKLKVNNNIEAIRIARENNWWFNKELLNYVAKRS